jgi:hypothetical protein
MNECEQRVGPGKWKPLSVEDGRPGQDDIRCGECHGKVQFHKTSQKRKSSQAAHFEHSRRVNKLPAHDGCSLAPKKYVGPPKRGHPEPLE